MESNSLAPIGWNTLGYLPCLLTWKAARFRKRKKVHQLAKLNQSGSTCENISRPQAFRWWKLCLKSAFKQLISARKTSLMRDPLKRQRNNEKNSLVLTHFSQTQYRSIDLMLQQCHLNASGHGWLPTKPFRWVYKGYIRQLKHQT